MQTLKFVAEMYQKWLDNGYVVYYETENFVYRFQVRAIDSEKGDFIYCYEIHRMPAEYLFIVERMVEKHKKLFELSEPPELFWAFPGKWGSLDQLLADYGYHVHDNNKTKIFIYKASDWK